MDLSHVKRGYVTDPREFLRKSTGEYWFTDTETTGFELWGKDNTYSLQIMDEHGNIGIFFNTEENYHYWDKLLTQPDRVIVFFNACFDMNAIRKLKGSYPEFRRIRDVMVQYRLLHHEGKYQLKVLIEKLLKVKTESKSALDQWKEAYRKKRKISAQAMKFIPYDIIPPKILIPYALDDVIYTAQLFYLTYQSIKDYKMMGIYNTECALIPELADMKWRGIPVDSEGAYRYKVSLMHKLHRLEKKIYKTARIRWNINSNKETEKVMLKLGYKLRYNYTGNAQLDKFALARMKGDLPPLLSRHSSLDYEISHYLVPISSANGRLHTDLNQVGALTGRFSSFNPNLQNMYRGPRIRRFFLPEPGHILFKADYSQIEMRVFAGRARIQRMLGHIKAEHDLHEMAAVDCTGKSDKTLRQVFKTINFLIIYGGGAERLYFELQRQAIINNAPELLKVPYPRSAHFMNRYRETYNEIPQFFMAKKEELEAQGFIRNFYGRCYFPTAFFNVNTSYKGVNYDVQGSAADLIKRAMVKLSTLRLPMQCLLQVHDELVYSIPKDEPLEIMEEEIKEAMVNDKIAKLVPIKVECEKGEDYGHTEKITD